MEEKIKNEGHVFAPITESDDGKPKSQITARQT